jgi:hypothetical protein
MCAVLLLQVLSISEAKQALLAEAAQQHHQQQHQQRPHSQRQEGQAAAAAAADGSLHGTAMLEGEDGEEDGSELEGEVDGDADVTAAGATAVAGGDTWAMLAPGDTPISLQQRRRRSSSSAGAPKGGAAAGSAAAATAAAAPTTLQSVAPKREAVGREEVVGLLAAVMKQRGGRE